MSNKKEPTFCEKVGIKKDYNNILRAALIYVNLLKWPVFPVVARSKRPATTNGFKDATTDNEVIKKWFINNPNYNIGLATGCKSGVSVVDVDIKNVDGRQTIKNIANRYGVLPKTITQQTGSGGIHYLFQHPNGLKSSVEALPGIDIRAEGGYIVLPPSRHQNGESYRWMDDLRPMSVELANLPDFMLNLIKRKDERVSKKDWSYLFNNTSDGVRNVNLTSLTGLLLRRYVDPYLVFEIIKMWNQTRVNPPLSIGEIEKVFESIAEREVIRRQG
ncbi:bifunctional DNA primase/polymerase [Paraliobacillus quinghaiensis]|nr:bifunctional DNA primase/polymerase [Paraliobacillus quinghaiensis]